MNQSTENIPQVNTPNRTEFYYNIELTPDVYNKITKLGYRWVNSLERFILLMNSLNTRGACWETIVKQLENPNNINSFRNGPNSREAWITEVDKLVTKRSIPHDWLNDHRHWVQKMQTNMDKRGTVTDSESNAIYNKWLNRQFSNVLW